MDALRSRPGPPAFRQRFSRPPKAAVEPGGGLSWEKRLNQTHCRPPTPRPGCSEGRRKEAKLCFMVRVLMENRHGLVISPLTAATGTAERKAAEAMGEGVPGRRPLPWAAKGHIPGIRPSYAGPEGRAHVAQHCDGWKPAIDGRTTRHPGYAGQSAPAKAGGGNLRLDGDGGQSPKNPPPRPGPGRLGIYALTAAAYNLVRIRNLLAVVSP